MYDGFRLTCSALSRRGAELYDEELCREGPLLRELPNPENNDPPDELEDDRLWELGPEELLLPKEPELLLRKLLEELRLLLRKLLDELRLLLELLLCVFGGIFTSFINCLWRKHQWIFPYNNYDTDS